jgi:parallel beta-helix repeat protein
MVQILGDHTSVSDFGAVGDGATDDTAAIQAAINTAVMVIFPAGYTFKVSATLSVPSNRTLYMYGAVISLAANVNNHVFKLADGASNVTFLGGEINGNKSGPNAGGHGIATGVTATKLRIVDVAVHDCGAYGIYTAGAQASPTQDLIIRGCRLYNNGGAGIALDNYTDGFSITGNTSFSNGGWGIGAIGVMTNGTISGNTAESNGPNADNFTGYNYLNDNVTISGNASKSSKNNGMHFGGSNIVYCGNTDEGAAFYGIVHFGSDGTNVQSTSGVVMSGNHVKSCGGAGIWLQKVTSGSLAGNTIDNAGTHGLEIDTGSNLAITGNTFANSLVHGMRVDTCSALTITGNVVYHSAAQGIDLVNTTVSTVSGNTSTGNTNYGILENSPSDYNLLSPNNLHSNGGAISASGAHSITTGNLT